MTYRLAALALLALLLAACYPATPAGVDPAQVDLNIKATQAANDLAKQRATATAIEATRAAAAEQARIDEASIAELALINGRANAESTALAGQVTAWAMAQEKERATQMPPKLTASAIATQVSERATQTTIKNNTIADQTAMLRREDWEDFKLFFAWTVVYTLVILASIAAILLLIYGLRKTAVRENNNGTVIIFDGLLEPRVGVARREQLPAQVQQRRSPVFGGLYGDYVIGPDGRQYWAATEQEQPEPEPEVVEADYYEPQGAQPAEPEYYQEWPYDQDAQALLVVRGSLEVLDREPVKNNERRLPYYIVGSRDLERLRACGVHWSSGRWQRAVDHLERCGWLAPGDGSSSRRVIDQVHTLAELEQYLVSGRPVPPPVETF